jgi:transcriptional regulator with XRE-family HTH domain
VRLDRCLTQEELAERAGMSPSTVERIERNRDGNVSLRELVTLALVLDCESVLEVIDDDWLEFQPQYASIEPPPRAKLERSAGREPPRHQRDRAPRRRKP